MFKVEIQSFNQLTEAEREDYGSSGDYDYTNFLRVTHNGETLYLKSDAMESEDAFFHRDLAWVPRAIQKAYELGKADAAK